MLMPSNAGPFNRIEVLQSIYYMQIKKLENN